MKKYLLVIVEYREIYNDDGNLIIDKIPYIKNYIIEANNIMEVYKSNTYETIVNIIELESR